MYNIVSHEIHEKLEQIIFKEKVMHFREQFLKYIEKCVLDF